MITPEQTQQSLDWLNTSITIRQPKSKQKFCDSIGISVPTLNKIDTERGKKPRFDTPNIDDLPIDDKIKLFDSLLFQLIQDPKTPSKTLELFAKRYGLLVDKSETKVNIVFNADEYARIDAEAERRSRDFREQNRTLGLQEKPLLLPSEIREDTGCQSGGDTIQPLATSDTNP